MNTRRRLLAGLAAIGLIPSKALGQATSDPKVIGTPVFYCGHKPALGPSGQLVYDPVKDTRTIRYVYIMNRPIILSEGVKSVEGIKPQAELELHWTDRDGAAARYDGFHLKINGISPEGLSVVKGDNPFGPKSKINVMMALDFPGIDVKETPYHLEAAPDGSYRFYLPFTRDVDPKAVEIIDKTWKLQRKFRVTLRTPESSDAQIRTAPFPYSLPAVTKLFPAIKQTLEEKLDNNECEIIDQTQGCFLTTASVNAVGLDDNCAELRCLRKFRDGPLQERPGGAMLVDAYYDRAPIITAQINMQPNARAVWLRTYCFGILPCVILIKIGLHGLALRLYARMCHRLNRLASRQGG